MTKIYSDTEFIKFMFRNNIVKITSVFLGLSVLTIGFLVLWLVFSAKQTGFVQATINGTPLQGWAWTDTYGWISLNCRNENVCATSNYWVGVDESTGQLDGYAWSSNVGWISFRKTGICMYGGEVETNAEHLPKSCEIDSDCFNNDCQHFTPPNYDFNGQCQIDGVAQSCAITDNCLACYNNTDRQFYGWARVLSEASNLSTYEAGWIRLDDDNTADTFDYGLSVSQFNTDNSDFDALRLPKGGAPWGDLSGWAWGGGKAFVEGSPIGENATSGIGWIGFNCNNTGAGGCAKPYKVTGRPNALGALKLQRTEGNESYSLKVDWSNGYPAYGTSYYEVWRKNGLCYFWDSPRTEHCSDGNVNYCPQAYCQNNQCYFGGSALSPATPCTDDPICQSIFVATCQDQDYQRLAANIENSSDYEDQDLELFVKYRYVVRACNIFACSRSSAGALQTSPIEGVHNFKAVPICTAPNAQVSYVDLVWSKPLIVDFSGVGSDYSYELSYCKLDVSGDVSRCSETDWQATVANCTSLDSTKTSCRETLDSNNPRYQSKDFYVYRLRAVANSKGTCLGGDNDGQDCSNDTFCPGGACDFFKGTWAYSNNAKPFRICSVSTSYQEQRPR